MASQFLSNSSRRSRRNGGRLPHGIVRGRKQLTRQIMALLVPLRTHLVGVTLAPWGIVALSLAMALTVMVGTAAGASAQRPRSGAPTKLSWYDATNNTAFTLDLITGAFGFTVPPDKGQNLGQGDLVTGTLGSLIPADGQFRALFDDCTSSGKSDIATVYSGQARDQIQDPVTLAVTLSGDQLNAYVSLWYLPPPIPFVDSAQQQSFACGHALPPNQPQLYVMASGCTGSSPSQSALPTVSCVSSSQQMEPSATTYGEDLKAATTSNNWSTLYGLTAQTLDTQYSESQFAAAMNAQVSQLGTIANVATDAPSISLHYDDGQPYFSVQQTITLSKGGANSTQHVTSYFLLDDQGLWKFWFSK